MFEAATREIVDLVKKEVATLDKGSLTDGSLDNCRIAKITFSELYDYVDGHLQRRVNFTPERATELLSKHPEILHRPAARRFNTLNEIIKHTFTAHFLHPLVPELEKMVVDQYGWFSITEARTVFDRLPGLWTEVKGLEHRYPQPSMINLIECLGHFSGPSPTEDDLDRPDDSEVLHRAAGTAAQWAKALGGKHHAEAKVVARQLKELAEGFRLLQEGKLDAETFRGPARGLSI